ncbi:hypothetical protein IAD21_05978 [Abditibacteriota bacterium]|nr:hypothetical protein IAD21_05978 [Abditibacteriota bacterium]
MMLPASQLVEARLASIGLSGRTMRGQWKLTTDVTGKATTSGEVARWVVEPGTHVNAGDSVVEISSGAASRPAPMAESRQNQAEKEQVAAANGQTALAQKLSMAQIQLAASLERVEHAQAKVSAARTLVKRLLAGEKIPVTGATAKPARSRIVRENPEGARLDRERKHAQDVADEARSRVSDAKSELDEAKKALAKAQKQADAAAAALTKAEADFKVEKATADVLQNARADADDAQASLKAAQTRADVAQRAYSVSQDKASASENAASDARSAAQKASTTQVEAPTATTEDESGRYMTADQAATLVADALRESKAATRQADRIHARVDDYQRQVRDTSQRVESASNDLQKAQQRVLDSVPRPQFTATRAPATGTVTWISRLAREVGVGQTVFGISQGRNGFLRFEDKSGAWKALNVGQTLNAASTPTLTQTNTQTSDTSSMASPVMPASKAISAPTNEVPIVPIVAAPTFSIRITRITPPTNAGEGAQIDAVRTDGSTLTSDSTNAIQAELPLDALPVVPNHARKVGPQPVIVPLSVILPRDGSSFVAVVGPTTEETKPTTLEWRPVQIERQTAFDVEIKSGLRAGERVVTQPILLLSEIKPEQKTGIPVIIEASD